MVTTYPYSPGHYPNLFSTWKEGLRNVYGITSRNYKVGFVSGGMIS